MTHLILGPLVSLLGLFVILQQAAGAIRDGRREGMPASATPSERALTTVFLGVIPLVAGAIFVAAWWVDDGVSASAAPVQAMYAPLN